MPQKVLINFSDEQIAKIGACKTAADFQSAVDLAIEASGAPKVEQKVITIEDATKMFAKNLETFNSSTENVEAQLKVVAADVAKVNPDELIKKAEAAGSHAAAKALGKVGASGAGAANSNPNEGDTQPNTSAALIAEGKFEEAWKADKGIQAEFSDPKSYAGYMKASKNGQVRISNRN